MLGVIDEGSWAAVSKARSPEKRCDLQELLVNWNYDARYAFHLNAPYFEAAAGDTFKGVEVAVIAL